MQAFETPITNAVDYYSALELQKDKANVYRNDLLECYKIVENFIKSQGRILVGGMAIDFAMKLKGKKLYNTEKVDYDFISPNFHADAYNLGTLLAKKFNNISIIGALHVSTMKVRYRFMDVADITYVPEELYNKIKVLDYDGIKIIHPHFQLTDQFRAMSMIVESPPRETFFSERLVKDIKRFCLLSELYPFDESKDIKSFDELKTISVDKNMLIGNCLGGMTAVVYWLKKLSIDSEFDIVIDKNAVKITMPKKYLVSIFSDEPEKIESGEIKAYAGLLDKLPEKSVFSDYEVFNTKGIMFVADKLNDIYIAGLFATMVYLACQWLFSDDLHAGTMFKVLHEKILEDFQTNVSLISNSQLFGQYNWSESYKISVEKILLSAQKKKLDGILPRNAYPKLGESVQSDLYNFDPEGSHVLYKVGQLKPGS